MKRRISFWHPQSALLLEEPVTYASAGYLGRLLGAGREVPLRYAGDRMWPGVRHGSRLLVRPLAREPRRGDVVVAVVQGFPDALRVRAVGDRHLTLTGDADPREIRADRQDILGGVDRASRPPWERSVRLNRLLVELQEACRYSGTAQADAPEESVREKYDVQAAFYLSNQAAGLSGELTALLEEWLVPKGSVLVVGSGTGRECFALREAGWRSRGIDFSAAMVDVARKEASRLGVDVEFRQLDIFEHDEPGASLDGILFTADVYSFLPGGAARVDVLRRMRGWLRPEGCIVMSAREMRGLRLRFFTTLEWLAGTTGMEWGDSHTRYVTPAGDLARSYVHRFTPAALRSEVSAGGLEIVARAGGHLVLRASTPGSDAPSLT